MIRPVISVFTLPLSQVRRKRGCSNAFGKLASAGGGEESFVDFSKFFEVEREGEREARLHFYSNLFSLTSIRLVLCTSFL